MDGLACHPQWGDQNNKPIMIGNGDVIMNFIKSFSFLHQYLQIQTVLAGAMEDHHFLGLFYGSVLCWLTRLTEVHKSLKIKLKFS